MSRSTTSSSCSRNASSSCARPGPTGPWPSSGTTSKDWKRWVLTHVASKALSDISVMRTPFTLYDGKMVQRMTASVCWCTCGLLSHFSLVISEIIGHSDQRCRHVCSCNETPEKRDARWCTCASPPAWTRREYYLDPCPILTPILILM